MTDDDMNGLRQLAEQVIIWESKGPCYDSSCTCKEVLRDFRYAASPYVVLDLLNAIERMASDRDVLLSAMTTLSTAQQSVLLLEYVHGVARAAIQKVQA